MNPGKKLHVGVIGLVHDHVWTNLEQLQHSNLGEIIAVADPNPELLEKFCSVYNCQQVFESYEFMLQEVALDAVIVYTDNATSVDVVKSASNKGIHAMVEKPMAATLSGADQMLVSAEKNGISLMINWPFAWRPGVIAALEMAKAGEIGEIFSVKYRAAHAGPKEFGCTPYFYNWLYDEVKNGAGALVDYCCYGAALSRYLLDQPSRVFGVADRLQKNYIPVDDNAVIIMQWSSAVAISEASWTQIGDMTSYETIIYGSKGTLLVERGDNGRLWHATQEHPDGVVMDIPPLPANRSNASMYFMTRIKEGLPIDGLCSPIIGRDVQEILEAGIFSANLGKQISLPLPLLRRK